MKFATFGRIAVTALLIAAPLGVASAADMAVKAPKAPPPPPFDWNGFYVGGYAGAAWMDQARTTDPCPVAALGTCNTTGVGGYNTVTPVAYDMAPSFIGGVTVGYNWQPTPYTLIGLENDFGYLHLKGSIIMNPPGTAFPVSDTVASTTVGDWYDAYTARIGAVDGHAMFYLKGGGVSARLKTGVVDASPVGGGLINTTTTKTLTGWAAGGGVEYGIDNHWSVKGEYLVMGLPMNTTNCGPAFIVGVGANPANPFCAVTRIPNVQTITLGLNYRFH